MTSNLKLVGEVELPEPQSPEGPKVEVKMEPPSARSSAASPHVLALMAEIRRVLNARAAAQIAMVGAMMLTVGAMWQGTLMSLAIAASFDLLVFLPIAVIAYMKRE